MQTLDFYVCHFAAFDTNYLEFSSSQRILNSHFVPLSSLMVSQSKQQVLYARITWLKLRATNEIPFMICWVHKYKGHKMDGTICDANI